MTRLKVIWTVLRSSPTVLYYVVMAFRYLPVVIPLLIKIREVFGSEEVQTVVNAITALIQKMAPPAPSGESGGTNPSNLKWEKRKRMFRFRNRLEVAGILTDSETQELCSTHNTNYYCA